MWDNLLYLRKLVSQFFMNFTMLPNEILNKILDYNNQNSVILRLKQKIMQLVDRLSFITSRLQVVLSRNYELQQELDELRAYSQTLEYRIFQLDLPDALNEAHIIIDLNDSDSDNE